MSQRKPSGSAGSWPVLSNINNPRRCDRPPNQVFANDWLTEAARFLGQPCCQARPSDIPADVDKLQVPGPAPRIIAPNRQSRGYKNANLLGRLRSAREPPGNASAMLGTVPQTSRCIDVILRRETWTERIP